MGKDRIDRALDALARACAYLLIAIAIAGAVWLATKAGGQ